MIVINDPSLEVEAFDDGFDGYGYVLPVALDKPKNTIYYAKVCFSPYDGEYQEYSFSLVLRHRGKGVYESEIHSGLKTKDIFTRSEDREFLMSVVEGLTHQLLRQHAHHCLKVYRCTNDVYDGKGLEKHARISRVFEEFDYKIECTDQWHGRRWWKMLRV